MIKKREIPFLPVEELLAEMARKAEDYTDGHFTVFSFTDGYKSCFGTVDVDGGCGRNELFSLKSFKTLKESLVYTLMHGVTI